MMLPANLRDHRWSRADANTVLDREAGPAGSNGDQHRIASDLGRAQQPRLRRVEAARDLEAQAIRRSAPRPASVAAPAQR